MNEINQKNFKQNLCTKIICMKKEKLNLLEQIYKSQKSKSMIKDQIETALKINHTRNELGYDLIQFKKEAAYLKNFMEILS